MTSSEEKEEIGNNFLRVAEVLLADDDPLGLYVADLNKKLGPEAVTGWLEKNLTEDEDRNIVFRQPLKNNRKEHEILVNSNPALKDIYALSRRTFFWASISAVSAGAGMLAGSIKAHNNKAILSEVRMDLKRRPASYKSFLENVQYSVQREIDALKAKRGTQPISDDEIAAIQEEVTFGYLEGEIHREQYHDKNIEFKRNIESGMDIECLASVPAVFSSFAAVVCAKFTITWNAQHMKKLSSSFKEGVDRIIADPNFMSASSQEARAI